jgi:hypothetical protein
MSLFEEIYGFEDSPKPSTVKPKALPETQLDDWRWQITPATSSAAATCRKIEDAAFTKAILGEMPKPSAPEPEPEAATPIEAAMGMFFAKGAAGGELRRKVQKSGLGISEAMIALLNKFQEFFTLHEQRIMEGKIKCLDVPGFLEMLNSKLEVA